MTKINKMICLEEDIHAKLKEEENTSGLIEKLLRDYYNSIKPSEDPKAILEDLKCKSLLIAEEKEIMDKKVKEIEEKEKLELMKIEEEKNLKEEKERLRKEENERWRSLTREQQKAEKPHLFSAR